jgi:hypothetical protein
MRREFSARYRMQVNALAYFILATMTKRKSD